MSQAANLINAMFMFGWPAGALAFVAATIWSMLVWPTSPMAILMWLVGAGLNVPLLILLTRIVAAGQSFTPASDQALLYLVVFYGIGAAGIGWLTGSAFGSLIRVLIAKESMRPS